MSSVKVDCNNGPDVLEALNNFLTVGHHAGINYANCAGSVVIDDCIGTSATIYENIVVLFTDTTTYNVSAQYSGVLGSGIIGTTFNSSKIKFTITNATSADNIGNNIPVAGDKIVIKMTRPWQSMERSYGSNYLWKAPGNDDLRKIYVGMSAFSSPTGGFFNSYVRGSQLYNETTGKVYNDNRNKIWALGPDTGQACTLFAKADGKFCYAICKIGTVYSACCFGHVDMINSYDEHFCPMLLGGGFTKSTAGDDMNSVEWKWTYSTLRSPILGNPASSRDLSTGQRGEVYTIYNLALLTKNNLWSGVGRIGYSGNIEYGYFDYFIKNWNDTTSTQKILVENIDGSYPIFKLEIIKHIADDHNAQSENGYIIPFVAQSANTTLTNTVVVPETKLRDTTSRQKYMYVSNGYIVDQYNFYCVEIN